MMPKAQKSIQKIANILSEPSTVSGSCCRAESNSRASRIDHELGKIEYQIGLDPQSGCEKFVQQLAEAIYYGERVIDLPLSDGTLISIYLPSIDIQIVSNSSAGDKLLASTKDVSGIQYLGNKKGTKRKKTKGSDEDIFGDSLEPEFYLEPDYDGTIPLWFQLLSGHPYRPTLFFTVPGTPENIGTLYGDKWPLFVNPSNYIIWWQDSPIEAFNVAAEKALSEIGATFEGTVSFQGIERNLWKLPHAFGSGLISPDGSILDAFFNAENKIDDDLLFVPTEKEVRNSISLLELSDPLIELNLNEEDNNKSQLRLVK